VEHQLCRFPTTQHRNQVCAHGNEHLHRDRPSHAAGIAYPRAPPRGGRARLAVDPSQNAYLPYTIGWEDAATRSAPT